MKKFNHLHCHSTHSFLDGYGTADQYVKKLKKNNQTSFGLTDHGSTWGHIPFYFKLIENGIKPILGCEMYYNLDATKKERKRYHLTVLARNNTGFENLNIIQTYANNQGFYYKPTMGNDQLQKYGEGLIVLSGCMGSGYPIRVIQENKEKVLRWLQWMKNLFRENFYLELSPLEYNQEYAQRLIPLADNLKIPIAITSDVHFPNKEDHMAEDIMLTIGMKSTYKNPDRMKLSEELYLWDNEEAFSKCEKYFGKRTEEFIENSNKISNKCNVEINKAKPLHFFRKDSNNQKALELFDKWIREGIEKRKIHDKKYLKRINYERNIIVKKGFVNYFLIISDLIKWSKKRMLVGAGRGSSAGSLISYILDITEIDPIKHDLMFERFIDMTREDLPDIDIDFPHIERQIIIDYLVDKYGENKVSLLGTLSYFKGKNSIWDVGRIFSLPLATSKELTNGITSKEKWDESKTSFIDSVRESKRMQNIIKENPEYKTVAKIEGQVRQSSVHAAAVVISEEPLFKFGSFKMMDENRVICIDKPSSKKIDLLKIDVLALKQLSVLQDILKEMGKNNDFLYSLDIEDSETYKTIREGKFEGIFQFEGGSLKPIVKDSKPDSFESFQEISAIARPGALVSGTTEEFMKRKLGKSPIKYIHPLMESITKSTYGMLIYQEQIMKVINLIGNIDMRETNKVRKLIDDTASRDTINKHFEKFKKGAIKNGLKVSQVEELWDSILSFSSYAFNKSHSVSYGYISYWSLYLKTHHCDLFFITTLKYEKEDLRIKKILKEWVLKYKRKFIILDPNKSEINFSIHDGVIYGGFKNLKGLGQSVAEKIVKYKNCLSVEIFEKEIGKKSYKILEEFNAIPEFKHKQLSLFDDKNEKKEFKNKVKIPYAYAPWANLLPVDENRFKKFYKEFGFNKIETLEDESVKVLGMIYQLKSFPGNNKIELEDNTGIITVYISTKLIEKEDLKLGNIIAVEGNKFGYKIYAKKIKMMKMVK